jgi:hypothetical protein
MIGRFTGIVAALLVVVAATSAHGANTPWESRGITKEAFWTTLETLYGEQSEAVCLVHERVTKMDLRAGRIGKSDTHHMQIAVLDAKAAEEYANVEIPYVKSWDKITELYARTITRDGREIKVEKDQIYDVDLFPEYVLYSDFRGKRFAFPGFTDHCVVAYEYTVFSDAPFVWTTHFFQGPIPTEVSRCRIEVPVKMLNPLFRGVGWEQVYSGRNLDIEAETERINTIDGEVMTYNWELENVPAVEPENYRPAPADICPSISFAPGIGFGGGELTWESFGNWFHKAMEERLDPGDEIKSKVRSLTEAAASEGERVEAICDYIREDIRYVAVELDEGSWFPSGVNLTDKVQYGDCKDQSALLVAMLREAGIDAELALVRTRDRGSLNTAIVSPGGFNHCIVHLPGEGADLWLDPTAKHHCLGTLPWQVQGVDALLLRPYESELAKTPQTSYQENSLSRMATVDLSGGSEPSCSGTIMIMGERAARLRYRIADAGPGRARRVLKEFLKEQCPGSREEDVSIDGVENPNSPLVVRFVCKSAGLTAAVEEYTLASPTVFALPGQVKVFDEPERIHPVCFHFPERVLDEVIFKVPEDLSVLEVPEHLTLEKQYGYFEREWSAQDGQAHYKSRLILPGRYVPLEGYSEMTEFAKELHAAMRDAMSLRRAGRPAE